MDAVEVAEGGQFGEGLGESCLVQCGWPICNILSDSPLTENVNKLVTMLVFNLRGP